MKKLILAAALPLALLSASHVAATGNYSIGDIDLDGSSWTDESTVVTIGETYPLAIALTYQFASLVGNDAYVADQSISLNLNSPAGSFLGSAEAASPNFRDTFVFSTIFGPLTLTDNANWLLDGDFKFDESFGPAGIYTVAFSGDSVGDGALRQNITVQAPSVVPNPVPAPGTLAIMALGLLGLGFMRRRNNRA